MIRRAYITMLLGAGLLLASLGVASLRQYVGWRGLVTPRHWFRAEIDGGNIRIVHARVTDHTYSRKRTAHSLGVFGRVGFWSGTAARRAGSNWRYASVVMPLWTVVAALFAYPAFAFVRGPLLHRKRLWRNQCANCGYDRTANTSGMCPECGGKLRCDRCGRTLSGLPEQPCPTCRIAPAADVSAPLSDPRMG